MNARLKLHCLGYIVLLTFACGCAAISNQFVGSTVSSAPVVALHPGGPHADAWQTFDMKIDYEYRWDGDMFEIYGLAGLTQHYELMFSGLRDLRVYLFLLDAHSRVLEASMVARSLTSQLDQKLRFNKSFKVPPGTAGFSFGYEGQALAEKGNANFYLLPLNK